MNNVVFKAYNGHTCLACELELTGKRRKFCDTICQARFTFTKNTVGNTCDARHAAWRRKIDETEAAGIAARKQTAAIRLINYVDNLMRRK